MRNSELYVLFEPLVKSLDYLLLLVEMTGDGESTILRVYIDHPDGINVDDCAKVSREISALMDVEDPISQAYTLEVSSPGLDRPLVTAEHFLDYVGEAAKIQLVAPLDGRRRFKGTIKQVIENDVELEVDNELYLLPIDSMDSAKLVPNFDSRASRR